MKKIRNLDMRAARQESTNAYAKDLVEKEAERTKRRQRRGKKSAAENEEARWEVQKVLGGEGLII